MNALFTYILLVAVTLGISNVPHALFYEDPELVMNMWFRNDL